MLLGGAGSVLVTLASPVAMIPGVIVAALGVRELHAATALRALDPGAPGRLACNQLVLALVLVGAVLWSMNNAPDSSMIDSLSAREPALAAAPEFASMTRELRAMERDARRLGSYAALGASALVPLVTAAVYFRARRTVAVVHAGMPPWVLDVHRIMLGFTPAGEIDEEDTPRRGARRGGDDPTDRSLAA